MLLHSLYCIACIHTYGNNYTYCEVIAIWKQNKVNTYTGTNMRTGSKKMQKLTRGKCEARHSLHRCAALNCIFLATRPSVRITVAVFTVFFEIHLDNYCARRGADCKTFHKWTLKKSAVMIAAVRMTTILKQFPSVEGDGAHMLLRVPQIVTQNFSFDEVYHVFLYLQSSFDDLAVAFCLALSVVSLFVYSLYEHPCMNK